MLFRSEYSSGGNLLELVKARRRLEEERAAEEARVAGELQELCANLTMAEATLQAGVQAATCPTVGVVVLAADPSLPSSTVRSVALRKMHGRACTLSSALSVL